MEQTTDKPQRVHQGRNVKRIREFFGVKQENFAKLLGPDWTQKRISGLEDKETIEPELVEQVAKALNVSIEAITNMTDERATQFFNTNNFYDHSQGGNFGNNNNNTLNFNPLEKVMELVSKNEALYEQLLKVEREKNALLERFLGQK